MLNRARRNFRQALAIQPANEDALIGLALIELREGNSSASVNLLSRASGAASAKLLLARGNICYLDDDPERAAELYRQALGLKQGWSAAQKNLALTYEALGRDGDATDIWKALLDEPRLSNQARWQLVLLASHHD